MKEKVRRGEMREEEKEKGGGGREGRWSPGFHVTRGNMRDFDRS